VDCWQHDCCRVALPCKRGSLAPCCVTADPGTHSRALAPRRGPRSSVLLWLPSQLPTNGGCHSSTAHSATAGVLSGRATRVLASWPLPASRTFQPPSRPRPPPLPGSSLPTMSGSSSLGGGAYFPLALPSADRSARVGRASRLPSSHSRWTADRRRRHCWRLPTCAVGSTAAAAHASATSILRRDGTGGGRGRRVVGASKEVLRSATAWGGGGYCDGGRHRPRPLRMAPGRLSSVSSGAAAT